MALAASTPKAVLGSVAFGIFWVLAVFPAVPFLPVGRTAGSLLGAMLMVAFRVISPDDAYAAIDLPILGLLFGTMVVSIFLERADMFKYLSVLLSWKSRGAKDLLCRVCFVSALSSALFTNDTSCVVLTEFILKIARQNNLPPQPFLLALASSANIGSSTTVIGNPQNLVIAMQSKISFGKFLFGIFPAMLVGVVVNVLMLLCYFWKLLLIEKDEEVANGAGQLAEDDVSSHQFSPATMSRVEWNEEFSENESLRSRMSCCENDIVQNATSCRESVVQNALSRRESVVAPSTSMEVDVGGGTLQREEGDESSRRSSRSLNGHINGSVEGASFQSSDHKRWKILMWKTCVYLVTLGMLISFLMGLNMSWTAITAALALVVLDFKDARPCLEKVSYSLLIFFCGMFITVNGFNKTGIPSAFWDFIEPHARIDSAGGIVVLSLVILLLSNIASNVPTVLLLGARVAASASVISPAEETNAWLVLAWVSTVAGNLSLLGSAANLIVCEQARRAQFCGYNLSFWSHLRFGVPSTLIITAIGLLVIRSY